MRRGAVNRGPRLNLFESVVVHANDVVLVTEAGPLDRASGGPQVIYVNPAFTRMTGYEAEEIIGQTPRILQSPNTSQAELDRLRAALEAWEPVEVELLNVRKNGAEFWVQISITPVQDADGWYTHWIAIQRDVTDRKRREIAVMAMLDNTSDLLLVLDDTRAVTAASPTSQRLLDRAAPSLAGRRFLDLVHPGDAEQAAGLVAPAPGVRLGPGARAELRLQHEDGGWRWMEVNAVDLFEDRQSRLILSCTDITAHRRVRAELEVSNRQFRSAFDDAPLGMALTTPAGEFIKVNDALGDLLGRDPQTLVRLSTRDVTLDDEREVAERSRRNLLQSGAPRRRHETRFVHADGSVIDVLHSASQVPGRDRTPDHLVNHFEDITTRKSFEHELRHRVLHDTLTGLPNRVLLLDRLGQALTAAPREASVAILFLDIDRFKSVNDTYGHHVGDAVLVETAHRLQGAVGAGDTVCRLAGDEFVVLCRDTDAASAVATAARLTTLLAAPMDLGPVHPVVTVSIGVAVSSPHDTALTLLRNGDAAMYEAKSAGRARLAVFDEELGVRVRTRTEMESGLRKAVQDGQLRLFFQPQLRLTDGAVVGVEALVRWQHPERGLLGPGEFLDAAEESGLIVELGRWVLRAAAVEAARRRRLDNPAPPVVWVNISGVELVDPCFAAGVEDVLREHGLPGEAIGLEITESVLISDVDRGRDTLNRLREQGVHLGVDDFGTGYSSLSYLAQFPLDAVKIDRSFVSGLDEHNRRRECFAVVNAVIGLAHALKLQVIAEGVETISQVQILHGLGCEYAQGYLLGHPSPEGTPAGQEPLDWRQSARAVG